MIPQWAVDILACTGFTVIWCAIGTGAGLLIGRWLRHAQAPAPEASTPRAPGPEPRLLMSSRFYSDGVVYVDDHIKHRTTKFPPPPGDDDWLPEFIKRSREKDADFLRRIEREVWGP